MDDPTRWCENDASNGTRLPGPKRGPHFFVQSIRVSSASLPGRFESHLRKLLELVDLAIHGDSRLRQHMLNLRFAQSGCVIFK